MIELAHPCRNLALLALLSFAAALAPAARALADTPGDASPAESERYGRFQFDESEREHWAFLPVARPDVPAVSRAEWVQTPVDAFVLAEIERRGLHPAPQAEPLVRLRRVYLDLIGLPPTPEQQASFAADPSPLAWERVVDDLLARPEYGERWARHWLDVVRYAESNGYERDGAKPQAWRYRDWVIDALNRDQPFDRFLIEQIAGDELDDTSAEAQIATTFLRLGPWDDEPADPKVDRYDQLDDVIGAVSSTFLGLTVRCARCHDHKFEPIKQRDYARFQAIFEPLERPQEGRTDLDRMVGTREELQAYQTATAAADAVVSECRQQLEMRRGEVRTVMFREGKTQLAAEVIAAFETPAEQRNDAQKRQVREHEDKLKQEIMAVAPADVAAEMRSLEERIEVTNRARPADLPRAYIWKETPASAIPVTHRFERGDPYRPLEVVSLGLPAVLIDEPPPPPTPTATTSGRRLQLARWLATAEHPLTSRVIVNRIWQHHFGDGLVSTENDFGVMGAPPTHPELLDWLASDFTAGGWSIKRLHRRILLSSSYQVAATGDPASQERDPQVESLWRWKPRRLEAEAIRDATLWAAGTLNSAHGGPSVFPKISDAVLASQSRPGLGWKPSPAEEAQRRSIYVFAKRTLPVPELEVLDLPSSESSCEQRTVSTIAPQALTYFNGDFMHQQARAFAQRLTSQAPTGFDAQVELAYRLTVCRSPSADELALLRDYLQTELKGNPTSADAAAYQRGLTSLCLVLLNSNEFVYVE